MIAVAMPGFVDNYFKLKQMERKTEEELTKLRDSIKIDIIDRLDKIKAYCKDGKNTEAETEKAEIFKIIDSL